jgi:membrane protein YqaA with SNARE-associated domain
MSPIRRIFKKGNLYHQFYRRRGGYHFIGRSLFKLTIALILLGAVLYLINEYVYNITDATEYLTANFNILFILGSFLLSESTLGLLSPEIFVIWVKQFDYPWLWLLLIATISYSGAIIAYFIGTKLYMLPRIHKWIDETFAVQFGQIRRFGGLLIILAAVTPLPYPPVCIISGMVHFPFRLFLILVATRFLRFAAYAALIFQVI